MTLVNSDFLATTLGKTIGRLNLNDRRFYFNRFLSIDLDLLNKLHLFKFVSVPAYSDAFFPAASAPSVIFFSSPCSIGITLSFFFDSTIFGKGASIINIPSSLHLDFKSSNFNSFGKVLIRNFLDPEY
ncbi:hypothetical protein BpHYR1_034958 [Brachionus plicatilis]|uniref:Uncharacterized protein n=1 Tax=Brachionus plicatilis TaxID=10195 RepID=A0A3M7PPN4_BRAPC|nr:hypothetical protein BpHYR1_034958 [Brachionus plicatilis]